MQTAAQCLVTGGTGFIGRFVVRALLGRGHAVRVLCRDAAAARALFDGRVDLHVGDLADPSTLRGACRDCASVIHLGAVYRFGRRSAALMHQVNVTGTEGLLAEAAAARVERFVHVSSSGILSHSAGPISEQHFPARVPVRLPYRRSKWLAEQAVLRFAAQGFPATIASPTSPLGPEDVGPTPTGRMILDFLAGRFPFAGPTLLNFVDVGELAAGILAVADRGRVGERYILGGHHLWHAEFLNLLGDITGLPAPRHTLPWGVIGLGGVIGELAGNDRLCWETAAHCRKQQPFDLTKAWQELGWSAGVPVEASARAAVDWVRRQAEPRLRPVPIKNWIERNAALF